MIANRYSTRTKFDATVTVSPAASVTSKLDTVLRITDGGVWECRTPVLSWATRLRIRARLSLM